MQHLVTGMPRKPFLFLMLTTLFGQLISAFQKAKLVLSIKTSYFTGATSLYLIHCSYKYLIVDNGEVSEWEGGANRYYSADDTPTPSTVPTPSSKALVFSDGDFRVCLVLITLLNFLFISKQIIVLY